MFTKKNLAKYAIVPLAMGLVLPASIAVEAKAAPPKISYESGRFETDYKFKTIEFSGQDWAIRSTNDVMGWGGPQAPHPSDGEGKWVQGAHVNGKDELVVQNKGIDGGVELIATESTGYGTYEFSYTGDFDGMDPSNVLGIFTYDTAEVAIDRTPGMEKHTNMKGSSEIDFIEISRWGSADRPKTFGMVTVYPDDLKGFGDRVPHKRFDIPKGVQTIKTKAVWDKNYLRVITSLADGTVLSDDTQTKRVPRDNGTQQLRVNLWTTKANKSLYPKAEGDKITFDDATFTPAGEKRKTEKKSDKSTTEPSTKPEDKSKSDKKSEKSKDSKNTNDSNKSKDPKKSDSTKAPETTQPEKPTENTEESNEKGSEDGNERMNLIQKLIAILTGQG
ncbi:MULTISPECIES: hypothetical protein [unclassified Brevibacterium]|uniref:hypothetical protein n=1 Tax=unclassified Brevibacterium TaxID=2614124 RepID=UPI0008A2FF9E|nr:MULTISPECIES: hypothetical protein [unclassified Brevibacterium]OFL68574.1 hypothetical protein HMPREF2757_08000 [Brevibacterium sp. HMSC063G07]OFS25743.1 hypothetical protein HMPREF3162_07970 [Brevibacterium sp. HMSC07C04]